MNYEQLTEGVYLIEDLLSVGDFMALRDEFVPYYNPWCNKDEYSSNTKWYGIYKTHNDSLGQLSPILHYGTIACLKAKKILRRDLKLTRVSTNIQAPGQDGGMHPDTLGSHPVWTLNLFCNDRWDAEWGGQFVVNTKQKQYLGVIPIPNHAVLFDSRMHHKGQAPNMNCPTSRLTVAWTFSERS